MNNKVKIKNTVILLLLIFCLTACGNQWKHHYDLGMRYLSDGNYEEAIIEFEAAIEIDETKPDTYIRLAEAYIQIKNSEKAFDVAKQGYTKTKSPEILEKIKELVKNSDLLINYEKLAKKEVKFCVDGIYLGDDISEAKKKYSHRSDYLSNLMTSGNEDEEVDTVYNMPFLDAPVSGRDENEFGYIFAASTIDNRIKDILIISDYKDNQLKCANEFSPNEKSEKALKYFYVNENYIGMPDGEYRVFEDGERILDLTIFDNEVGSLQYENEKRTLRVSFKNDYIDRCTLKVKNGNE